MSPTTCNVHFGDNARTVRARSAGVSRVKSGSRERMSILEVPFSLEWGVYKCARQRLGVTPQVVSTPPSSLHAITSGVRRVAALNKPARG